MTRQQHSQDLGTSEDMSSNHFDLPERSSRAPSHTEDMDFESSGSTVRDGQADEHASEDTAASFGEHSRNLIEVIRKLEALGIDSTLSSLPKFVVVGDQSHGKSSIIEAICSISLPRSSGTCTRCPFRITTTAARPGEGWSCRIALSRRWVLGRGGRWEDNGAPAVDFTTVTDKSELEQVLRLAQVAILNPRLDPNTLLALGAAPAGLSSLKFSVNAIDLHICGPELPELSIVDLPGSINVAPDESEQHLVGLIEKLIKSYVKDEKARILLVASVDQDLENSTAYRFVINSKAQDRTMGVLTKPDLLDKSSARLEYIRNILTGKGFKLGESWYVTKNSPQEDLDNSITHQEARQKEEEFFARVPWCSNLVGFADRFGTKNLQTALSHKLVEHIEAELPDIIARVNMRLHDVSEKLEGMPGPPTNASTTVIQEVRNLEKSIEVKLNGNDEGATFRSGFKKLLRGFRDQLKAARPHINLATPGYVKPVLSIDSDEDTTMSDEPPSSSSKKRKATNGHATPVSTPSRSGQRASAKTEVNHESNGIVFSLDEIYTAFDRARVSDMADEIHPKVKQHFIRQSNAPWPTLTGSLVDEAQNYVGAMVGQCIVESLRARQSTALFANVQTVVESLCEEIWNAEISSIEHLLACEQHRPITFSPALTKNTEDIRARLRHDRTAERLDEYYDTLESERNVKVPVGPKRKEKINDAEFISKTLRSDKYAAVIDAMASPLAYYDLASARLIDNVATHLEYGVLYALETKLGMRLTQELKVSDEEYCVQLLAEDAEREAQRMRLQVEKAKLERAVEELEALPGQQGMAS